MQICLFTQVIVAIFVQLCTWIREYYSQRRSHLNNNSGRDYSDMSGVKLRTIIETETEKGNILFAVLSKIVRIKVVEMGNNFSNYEARL